jgi:hypothetical protein
MILIFINKYSSLPILRGLVPELLIPHEYKNPLMLSPLNKIA